VEENPFVVGEFEKRARRDALRHIYALAAAVPNSAHHRTMGHEHDDEGTLRAKGRGRDPFNLRGSKRRDGMRKRERERERRREGETFPRPGGT
jgi:hypothetical protein